MPGRVVLLDLSERMRNKVKKGLKKALSSSALKVLLFLLLLRTKSSPWNRVIECGRNNAVLLPTVLLGNRNSIHY